MQFYESSTKTGIVDDAYFLTGTDTVSYPLVEITRNINRWYYKAVIWIWKASGTWEFDDSNLTTLPTATTTLVNAQGQYALPTTALGIERVEVEDNGGNWVLLQQIDKTEIKNPIFDFIKFNYLFFIISKRNNFIFF